MTKKVPVIIVVGAGVKGLGGLEWSLLGARRTCRVSWSDLRCSSRYVPRCFE